MNLRRLLYDLLKVSNDVRAVRKGKVGKRLARSAYGRATGKLAARLFR